MPPSKFNQTIINGPYRIIPIKSLKDLNKNLEGKMVDFSGPNDQGGFSTHIYAGRYKREDLKDNHLFIEGFINEKDKPSLNPDISLLKIKIGDMRVYGHGIKYSDFKKITWPFDIHDVNYKICSQFIQDRINAAKPKAKFRSKGDGISSFA